MIVGGRDRDRTCDPFHVKGPELSGFQRLTLSRAVGCDQ